MSLRVAQLGVLISAVVLTPASSYSAEIKVLSANGMREVMRDLGPRFETATGHRLSIAFATVGVIVKSVQDGEIADVIIISQEGVERLTIDSKASAEAVTMLASSGIGLIVRKGAPKPDISTPTRVRRQR